MDIFGKIITGLRTNKNMFSIFKNKIMYFNNIIWSKYMNIWVCIYVK